MWVLGYNLILDKSPFLRLYRTRWCCSQGYLGFFCFGVFLMDNNQPVDKERRTWLIACGAAGGVAAAATGGAFVSTFAPSERAKAAGAPVEVDIAGMAPGELRTVEWRGKPVFVRHRTKKEIEEAANVKAADMPDPQADSARVKKPEWLVVVGVCTHLGCVPLGHSGDYDGWFCPCHGSVYDTSGRIRKGPAPRNLEVPAYAFLSDTKLQIG